jgi:hypothetical protein
MDLPRETAGAYPSMSAMKEACLSVQQKQIVLAEVAASSQLGRPWSAKKQRRRFQVSVPPRRPSQRHNPPPT